MTDRPILFSAPMILALLDGRKTQTRRVLTAHTLLDDPPAFVEDGEITSLDELDKPCKWPRTHAVGDRLWVREAWHAARSWDRTPPRDIPKDADIEHAATARSYAEIGLKGKLRPSMFMPRWASRLTLYVTDVRVQRLQDISNADAIAEGVERDSDGWRDYLMPQTQCCSSAKDSFRTLWASINGPDAWDENPWVAPYSFEVRHGNIDSLPADIGGSA